MSTNASIAAAAEREFSEKVALIRTYLKWEVPDGDFASTDDFDRDGVRFRVMPRKLLFVSHEFLSDFTETEIRRRLKTWRIGSKTRALPANSILFVTTDGPFVEGPLRANPFDVVAE